MKKFYFSQLFLLVMFSWLMFAPKLIYAEEGNVPFYCIGANCTQNVDSGVSLPAAQAHPNVVDQPCVHHSRGLFATIYGIIVSFFGFSSGSDCPPPASTTTTSVTTPASTSHSSDIQFVGHGVTQVAGQEMSISVPKLNNLQVGDVLIAMIGSDYAHVSSMPGGWKRIRQDVKNAGHTDDLAMQSYYKVVTSSETDSYTWEMETGRKDTPSAHQPLIAVDLYAFRGVDPTNPILASAAKGETEDPKAIDCPGVEGVAGGILICAYIGDDPGSVTAPSSMTQTSNFEIAGGDTYAIAYEKLTSNSNTGSRIATWDNPGRNKDGSLKSGSDFAQAVVLQPAH